MFLKNSIVRLCYIQQKREYAIRIHQMHLSVVEANIAEENSQRKAEILSIAQLILFLSQKAEVDQNDSATDFTLSIALMVREGGRWQELIDAVAAPEILLIGRSNGEERDEEDGDDCKAGIPSVGSLEKHFHKNNKSIDIANITTNGGDDVFAKMKELLLMPDLQLKETCQRLSGLSQLIHRLSEAEENFRLDDPEELGTRNNINARKLKRGEDFELAISLSSQIQQRVKEVLWQPDSGSELEVETLIQKISIIVVAEAKRQLEAESEIGGKETSSSDDGLEEIGSDAGEQNQDFDDDFCIHFLNNDAFASL